MRYWRSLTGFFAHPNWGTNLLFGGVCMLIPYVGPMVFIGYMLRVLARQPTIGDRPHERFDFGEFGEYLALGWRPVVVALIVGLLLVPVMAVFFVLLVAGGAMVEDAQPAGWPVMAVGLVVYTVGMGAVSVLATPMMLRAGFAQDLREGLRFGPAMDFVRLTFGSIIGVWLFTTLIGIPLALVGYLCCFVGVYPAMAIMVYVQWQLIGQLHLLYVRRGGEPFPVAERLFGSPDPVAPPPPVV